MRERSEQPPAAKVLGGRAPGELSDLALELAFADAEFDGQLRNPEAAPRVVSCEHVPQAREELLVGSHLRGLWPAVQVAAASALRYVPTMQAISTGATDSVTQATPLRPAVHSESSIDLQRVLDQNLGRTGQRTIDIVAVEVSRPQRVLDDRIS
jgi:hypothetical protein